MGQSRWNLGFPKVNKDASSSLSGPQRGSSLRTDPTSLPHGRCCGGTQPCGQPLSSTRRCHTQGTAAGSRFSRSWLLWPPRQGLPFLSQRACRGLHGQDYTSGLSSHKTIYLWRWIPRQLRQQRQRLWKKTPIGENTKLPIRKQRKSKPGKSLAVDFYSSYTHKHKERPHVNRRCPDKKRPTPKTKDAKRTDTKLPHAPGRPRSSARRRRTGR